MSARDAGLVVMDIWHTVDFAAACSHVTAHEQAVRADERERIRADVDALADAWVRGDSVEVSRLLVKLRTE